MKKNYSLPYLFIVVLNDDEIIETSNNENYNFCGKSGYTGEGSAQDWIF